ncbi:Uncharacterised protein [Turicibacter sanguinis]|nr:Uncharacterised protein [Turicibacter sanguinis]
MKKILTGMFLFIVLMTTGKTSFASEIIINDSEVQVIITKNNPALAGFWDRVDHYDQLYPAVTRGLSRPGEAHSLSSAYYFKVNASTSDIYSNYYFTNHNGRMNILLEEYYGQRLFEKTYKFYLYEQGTNKQILKITLDKGDEVIVHALNLSTSKGYYFKIVPNGQTSINGKVYR